MSGGQPPAVQRLGPPGLWRAERYRRADRLWHAGVAALAAAFPLVARPRRWHPFVMVVPLFLVPATALYIGRGTTGFPLDAFTYLAAGERLNAGHSLYGALLPSDRQLLNVEAYGSPLLSPPLIALVWRPLALLGTASVYVWWALSLFALGLTVAILWVRAPLPTALLATIASYSLALELLTANIQSLLVPGVVVVWYLWRTNRIAAGAALAVTLAALKLLPALVVLWLLIVAPRRSWRAVLLGCAALLAVEFVGVGVAAHFDYLRVMSNPASRTGAPAVVIVLLAAMVLCRNRPSLAFACAIVAIAVAWAPVFLVTLAAPLAWPAPRVEKSAEVPSPAGREAAATS